MHGVVGTINAPSARLFNKNNIGFLFSQNENYEAQTFSYTPLNFLEFSVNKIKTTNYEIIENYGSEITSSSIKIRLKEEGNLPAIAIGLNNFDGPSFNASEYIVASYGIDNLDFSLGIGWGALNKFDKFENKLADLDDNLKSRNQASNIFLDANSKDYFSGDNISIFGGLNYVLNESLLLKIEYDSYSDFFNSNLDNNSRINFGVEYLAINNLNISLFTKSDGDIFFKMSFVID